MFLRKRIWRYIISETRLEKILHKFREKIGNLLTASLDIANQISINDKGILYPEQ